ncbi:hypothetical protein ACOMHN_003038 [Nucella lapillus]
MSGHSRPSTKGREVSSESERASLVSGKGQRQVQNVQAARVYVFGDGDIAEDDHSDTAEFEMPEIRSRRGQNGAVASNVSADDHEEELFFEKEINDGETLQSLSLKYVCPMSELKRVNHLMQDQDFFALRVLKIPMRHHGYLAEMVKQEASAAAARHKPDRAPPPREPVTSDSEAPCSDVDFSDPETQLRIMRTVSIRDNFCRRGGEASRFLKKMDRDLAKLRQSRVSDRGSLDEVVIQLTRTSFRPLDRAPRSGTDCGVGWGTIVLVAVVFAVLLPLTYFLYVRFSLGHRLASGGPVRGGP